MNIIMNLSLCKLSLSALANSSIAVVIACDNIEGPFSQLLDSATISESQTGLFSIMSL